MKRDKEQITKLKDLLIEAKQLAHNLENINNYLDKHDEDEEQLDFDSRIECCDETPDNFDLKITSLRVAIDQWLSNDMVFSDIDMVAIASLDDENEALESFDVGSDDKVEFDWLFEQLDDIVYRISECISNYEERLSDTFDLSTDEIHRIYSE